MADKYVSIKIGGFLFPSDPDDFIARLNEKIAEQPVPRSEIDIAVTTECSYGEYDAVIELSYTRPETDEEERKRKAEQARYDAQDRARYEQLKKKFEK